MPQIIQFGFATVKIMDQTRSLFVSFKQFKQQLYRENCVGFCGIQTQIDGVVGEEADHHGPSVTVVYCSVSWVKKVLL